MKTISQLFFLLVVTATGCNGQNKQKAANTPKVQEIEGIYRYFADAATFRSCGAETAVGVISRDLENKYIAMEASGEPVYVKVTGYYEMRPNMEGNPRNHLIVEEIIAMDDTRSVCD